MWKVGGKLALSARKLVVSAGRRICPDELVVDVTTLGVGKTIFVGDPAREPEIRYSRNHRCLRRSRNPCFAALRLRLVGSV